MLIAVGVLNREVDNRCVCVCVYLCVYIYMYIYKSLYIHTSLVISILFLSIYIKAISLYEYLLLQHDMKCFILAFPFPILEDS